jgi:hypothetical protein
MKRIGLLKPEKIHIKTASPTIIDIVQGLLQVKANQEKAPLTACVNNYD